MFNRYCCATFAYGALHALRDIYLYPTTFYRRRADEMPAVDKALVALSMTGSAFFLWPALLRRDLIHLECLLRGKRPADYLPHMYDE